MWTDFGCNNNWVLSKYFFIMKFIEYYAPYKCLILFIIFPATFSGHIDDVIKLLLQTVTPDNNQV